MIRDGLLRQRLELFQRRSALLFVFTDTPLPGGDTDAYVLPVRELARVIAVPALFPPISPPRPGPLVLAFGASEHLRGAFLAGCDDFLKEPWDPEELEARIVRLLRLREGRLRAGREGYELQGRCLRLPDGREVRLSAHEAVVAGLLFANHGVIVSRRALSYALWGHLPPKPSRAVDMHVSSLRRKIGHDAISCVRGQGYLVD